MGGLGTSSTTSNTNASASKTPWDAAMPTIQSLFSGVNGQFPNTTVTGPEQGAIDTLTANGAAGNPFAPAASTAANSLLAGGGAKDQDGNLTNNLGTYTAGMAPYTAADYSTLNSDPVKNALDAINTNTTNSSNAAAAAAGRTGSGLSAITLAKNVASAEAPTILNQANTDTATRQAALNGVYNAGNTTSGAISGNNATANTNMENGLTAANTATNLTNQGPQQVLQAQELLKSIPASALGALAQIGIPLASLGSNTTSQSQTDGTSTASPLSDIAQVGSMFSGSNSAISGLTNAGAGASAGLSKLIGK